MTDILNAESMSTAEIRVARAALQMQEDVISFVRRMAQGRCDLARDEQRRRNVRLALILASIALTFFAGFVIKTVMFPPH